MHGQDAAGGRRSDLQNSGRCTGGERCANELGIVPRRVRASARGLHLARCVIERCLCAVEITRGGDSGRRQRCNPPMFAPGVGFGRDGEGYIRVCFASTEQTVKEALSRVKNFVMKTL